MAEFLASIPLFPVALTISAYLFGQWCQKKTKLTVFNPVLIAVALIIGILLLTGLDVSTYQADAKLITWLVTPATVSLALPLYEQLKILKKNLPAILAGLAAGTVTSLLVVWLMCCLFSLDRSLTVSLLPKSITSAMSMVLSEQNGGLPALTTVVTIVTGIWGCLIGPALCKLLRLNDPISQGVAFGTASHVIGLSKANEMGEIQSAVGSLSLACSGILTAILFPIMMTLI